MIRVDRVSKRFGAVRALDSVSLEIGEGERIAFVGTNGSGKTTLLRCLLGLLRFDGVITVAGVDVAKQPEVALRSIAYIPQIAPPLDAPIREVVAAYVRLRGKQVADVADRCRRLGIDLATIERKHFRELSGGMKQKLLAALALAMDTPVLVCDEPTANLDSSARAEFLRQLEERPKGSITLLCSHRLGEVRDLVDRVVELSEGTVSRDTPVKEALERAPSPLGIRVAS